MLDLSGFFDRRIIDESGLALISPTVRAV
jgi:hypothetical protein